MATNAPTHISTQISEAWPPESFKQHVTKIIEKLGQREVATRDAIKRLINPKCDAMTLAYNQLLKRAEKKVVIEFFKEVCDCHLEICMYNTTHHETYTGWMKNICNQAERLEELIKLPPTTDIVCPDWLDNIESMLLKLMESQGDEPAISEFKSKGKMVRRAMQSLDVPSLLHLISEWAKLESTNPPSYYWEKKHGIESSKKRGDGGELAKRQILTRNIKALAKGTFGRLEPEAVTSILNVLLDSNINVTSVSRIKSKKPVSGISNEERNTYLKTGNYSGKVIARVLMEADKTSDAETAKANGLSKIMIGSWRSQFGGMNAGDVERKQKRFLENVESHRQEEASGIKKEKRMRIAERRTLKK